MEKETASELKRAEVAMAVEPPSRRVNAVDSEVRCRRQRRLVGHRPAMGQRATCAREATARPGLLCRQKRRRVRASRLRRLAGRKELRGRRLCGQPSGALLGNPWSTAPHYPSGARPENFAALVAAGRPPSTALRNQGRTGRWHTASSARGMMAAWWAGA